MAADSLESNRESSEVGVVVSVFITVARAARFSTLYTGLGWLASVKQYLEFPQAR